MIKNTEAIVLRTTKYGESSIIVNMYTQVFGLQSYIIKGARSQKKTSLKSNYFQIGQRLFLTVYHQPNKKLQYIKEVQLIPQQSIFQFHILQQSILQYCAELLVRCVKEEEENYALYLFLSSQLDAIALMNQQDLANFPIHFTIAFMAYLGYGIHNNFSNESIYFHLEQAEFIPSQLTNCMNEKLSYCLHQFIEHQNVSLHSTERKQILEHLIQCISFQMHQKIELKSLNILHELIHL